VNANKNVLALMQKPEDPPLKYPRLEPSFLWEDLKGLGMGEGFSGGFSNESGL
jgi:hypothetical protein